MKVLIVDDEVIIRTGLSKVIPWKELGFELLPPAASAEEAIEVIRNECPDILLTDIRMYDMSGLELAEKAVGIHPDTEVIILSGYDDFQYTRQAIRQRVSDYLLKTSKTEDIIRTVLEAKKRIEQKRHVNSQAHFDRQKEQSRKLLQWLVHGDVQQEEDETSAILRDFGWLPSGMYRICLIEADGWGESKQEESLLLFAAANLLGESLPGITLLHGQQIVVISAEEDDASGGRSSQVAAAYRLELDKTERMLKCRLYLALGGVVSGWGELPAAYRMAEHTLRCRNWMSGNSWCWEGMNKRKGGLSICTAEEERNLSVILLNRNAGNLQAWITGFVEARMADPDTTVDTLEASVRSAVLAASRWLRSVTSDLGFEQFVLPDVVRQMPHSRELLFRQLYTIMEQYHEMAAAGQESHVRRAMAYISEHVGEDISLQTVARHIHVHPHYLSEIFRKETGMTFGDFVTGCKIRHAMHLLASSPVKVSEVAVRVGFEDVKYFSKLFKKHTGMTPSVYRDTVPQ
ncbi:helix-turn-helix domain-containing protein [Paenibacillus sp. P96]|uniref:Helix-turn-helix domain-containing protein n=1 Tax=Paenibacillus zeirhizosphaerae TaxID=2987519 RepID=A0ABT9FRM7_9BACL|nr:helix-turn-helix domain-containing protein [Paenibacillus sp. P96]MDP4097399.1 helix-turn-helix domain-containing protein [Paenibacillus sp. P96]